MFKCPCQVKYSLLLFLLLLMVCSVFADIGASLYTLIIGTAAQKARGLHQAGLRSSI